MKYHEIPLGNITFSNDKLTQLELHSFLNIINIINLQLSVLDMKIGSDTQLDSAKERTLHIADRVKQGDSSMLYPNQVDRYCSEVIDELDKMELHADKVSGAAIAEAKLLFSDMFDVLRSRSGELLIKMLNPDKWESINIEEYKDEFHTFFMAVEKNSKGRYKIIYNIARQEELDYLVQLDIESEFGHMIFMTLSFKDAVRDLVANARKYTPIGGQIDIGIYQDKSMLRFSVQDNGIGIPKSELEKVFEFGYRASNVTDKPTMGGGFGLTKAAHVTKQLGGRIFIGSTEGQGTRIRIEIPMPAHVLKQIENHA